MDQNVDATVLLDNLTNRTGSVLRIGGIRLNSKGLRAIRLQFRDHFVGRFPVCSVGDGNTRAVGAEALGDRRADARESPVTRATFPDNRLDTSDLLGSLQARPIRTKAP
jgi:hypothetical protein